MASLQLNDQLDELAVNPPASITEAPSKKGTQHEILKSSALVGGSSMVNIAVGIIRTKAMALLLGPAGFGLFGLYGSIADICQSVFGMGINSSGVRQIAEAVGSGDKRRIGTTTAVLRRTSGVLGVFGAALLLLFSRQASKLTFGTSQYASALSLLSIVVLLRLISAGQGALIQGMRRIGDLAKMNVLGAIFGTAISIATVYYFRERGVVLSLIGVAAMALITSWWYSRKVNIEVPAVTLAQVKQEAAALFKLGSAFMASGFMTMGVAYFVRTIIVHKVGLEATGLYQSAWTLGGLYVSFVLQAMGADFYPRLTAQAKNNAVCNRLVNEQTQVGLLLAGPGVIATLTLAPMVIAFFYSTKFGPAVEILRWICLGVILQVVSWPLGFIIIAKGRSALFFYAELAWTVVAVGLAWAGISWFGLKGAGIAFFGSYVFHCLLLYPIVGRLSGFSWSPVNKRLVVMLLSLIALVFCGFYVMPFVVACSVGAIATIVSGIYSVRALLHYIPLERIPRPVRRVLYGLRLADPASCMPFESGATEGVAQ